METPRGSEVTACRRIFHGCTPVACAIYLRPPSDISRNPSQCTDTYFTDFFLCEAAKQGIAYTTVPVFLDRIRRRMQNGCCNQATRIKLSILATSASMHHRMNGLQPNHMANARYRTTRADISVYVLSCRVITYTFHRYADMDASSASYLLSIRDVFSSPGASPETNFARYLHADTTTTTELLVLTIANIVVLSCRVSKKSSRDFRHQKLQ
jgi:hypothetical protein